MAEAEGRCGEGGRRRPPERASGSAQEPLSLALQALAAEGAQRGRDGELAAGSRRRGRRGRGGGRGSWLESGTLDDARFAVRYAEDKRELAGWGEERIRDGAGPARRPRREHIDAALAEGAEEELERAVALLRERGAASATTRAQPGARLPRPPRLRAPRSPTRRSAAPRAEPDAACHASRQVGIPLAGLRTCSGYYSVRRGGYCRLSNRET